jgi:hypothetical protein
MGILDRVKGLFHRAQYGRPHGRPHHKAHARDYHKKKRITFRWPAILVTEFKDECRLHGVPGSDVMEYLAWELLHKKHIGALKKKIAVEEQNE